MAEKSNTAGRRCRIFPGVEAEPLHQITGAHPRQVETRRCSRLGKREGIRGAIGAQPVSELQQPQESVPERRRFQEVGKQGPPGSNAAGHPCRAVSISVHTAVIGLRSSVGAQNGPNGARAWKSGGLAMVAEDDRQQMHAIGSPGLGGIQAGLLAAGAIGRHVDGLGHMAPSPR